MLSFRSLFRTHDTPELLDAVDRQLTLWLDHKGYDAAALREGPPLEIGPNVWGSVQNLTDDVGSQTMRARVVEKNGTNGAWTSELTVHSSPTGNRGWVWLDIHKPDDHGWTATPRLARTLVKALPARDGKHLLSHHPRVVREKDVEEVVDALTDPERRGLAFVAGTDHLRPVSEWRDVVELLLDDTVGLANAWVLSADATDKFNYLVGRSHEATAGFVRTYIPGMDIGNSLDGERHRFLTSGRIERSPKRAISRILGHRAREQMIGARLPVALRDLDRMLRRDVDTALLDELSPPVTPTSFAPLTPVLPSSPPAPPRRDSPSPEPGIPDYREREHKVEPAASNSLFESQLAGILSELLGTSEVTVDSLAQLGAMAKATQRAEAAREGIRSRLEELQDAVEEAELARDILREELNAEQLEHVSADEERVTAERRLRFTRNELARVGRADLAWSEPKLEIRDIRPDTFTELLERWTDFKYVVFTGDKGLTEDLDRHGNAGTWAGKAWEALLALDDYARISTLESYGRDVSGFLADTPQGCRSFSANRHTARESEGVQSNPRYRRPRELPVPESVDPAGRVFMGAHFKIAQSTTVSPRLHYLDATATAGVIYIGYLGPHLPTAAS